LKINSNKKITNKDQIKHKSRIQKKEIEKKKDIKDTSHIPGDEKKKEPTQEDTASISHDAKIEDREDKGFFEKAYNWITGESEDSSKLINQEKLNDFEKKQKETPDKYKNYRENQKKSDEIIKDENNKSLNSILHVETSPSGLDDNKVKKYEKKLKTKKPEQYKKYKELQKKAEQHVDKTIQDAKETLQDGVKKSDHYFSTEKVLNYGISGIDSYEADKQNKEAEIKEEKIKDKDHEKYKNLMKNKFSADMEIIKAKIESANGIQTIVDTVDITLGGAEKLVDFRNSLSGGHYKDAAWDLGEAGVRIGVSALLESGKAFDWAGKAGLKVLKTAGPGAKKLFSKGDDLLKNIAPEVYNTIKSSSGMAKKAVTEALDEGSVIVNNTLKKFTGKDTEEIWELIAEKPVEELIADTGKKIKTSLLEDLSIDTFDYDKPAKTFNQIIQDVKSLFSKNNIKPEKLEGPVGEIDFYINDLDSKRYSQWIQDGMDNLPKGMWEKAEGVKEIFVDNYIYKTESGVLTPGNLGACKPSSGQIVLNKSNLNKDLDDFLNRYLGKVKNNIKYQEAYNHLMDGTKERWFDTFYHEIFHQIDHDLGQNGKYFSQIAKNSPFLDKHAHTISEYAKKASSPIETAAETFRNIMVKKQELERDIGYFDEVELLLKLEKSEHWTQYKFLIDNYLKNNKGILEWI
jgi:hypothetical protein